MSFATALGCMAMPPMLLLHHLGTEAFAGTEEREAIGQRITVSEHGDLAFNGADFVHAHGCAEEVGGGILVIVGLLRVGGVEERSQIGGIQASLEDGGILQGDIVLHILHAGIVAHILELIAIHPQFQDAWAFCDSDVSVLVQEEYIVLNGNALGFGIALVIADTSHDVQTEDVVMDIGNNLGFATEAIPHIGHFAGATPGIKNGVIGELAFNGAGAIGAVDIAGGHEVGDKNIIQNLHRALVFVDVDGEVATIGEDAVLNDEVSFKTISGF